MAFNFNWSPLIADTSRARDMLTSALNKSPKPPIIVDDILVNELNLGSIPPELEILEIGDLAEDRFRGIFKMSYTGDAFLTLKTRVQANPLNTYLSTKPSFASPQPLAAASGLTIPLQITLSDIRLSGFVILVFTRQKGITLVFRNDPLESLKVSSTFDTIPFVRDYLQKEIEGQLRVLFMEDLPAIIHRLSLRLWATEFSSEDLEATGEQTERVDDGKARLNPLHSPPQNAVNSNSLEGQANDEEISIFSLDPGDAHATFSRKNLLRLAALTDSCRTLSLFTPPIQDVFFRAWAGAGERGDSTNSPITHFNLETLARKHGSTASMSSLHNASDAAEPKSLGSARPTLSQFSSVYTGSSMGSGRTRPHAGRKRKKRVVNLRRTQPTDDVVGIESRPTTPTSSNYTTSLSGDPSEMREGEVVTPSRSPENNRDTPEKGVTNDGKLKTPQRPVVTPKRPSRTLLDEICQIPINESPSNAMDQSDDTQKPLRGPSQQTEKSSAGSSSNQHRTPIYNPYPLPQSGGILEQAWMIKIATEIARKVQSEKSASEGFWSPDANNENPPPAYAA